MRKSSHGWPEIERISRGLATIWGDLRRYTRTPLARARAFVLEEEGREMEMGQKRVMIARTRGANGTKRSLISYLLYLSPKEAELTH
jgi:hypothetical protein